MGQSISTEQPLRKIAPLYGLEVANPRHLREGHSNTNWLFESQGARYVATVVDSEPLDFAIAQARILRWLVDHHVATSQIRLTVDGQLAACVGGQPVLVKRYIEGETKSRLDPAMLFQVGQALARLHQVPAPTWLRAAHRFAQIFEAVVCNQIDPSFGRWVAEQLRLGQAISADLPRGLIHADLFWDNIIFHEGQLQAIIDFERAMFGRFAFDLGMCIVGTCANNRNSIDLNWARELVKGYESIRPLEHAERLAIQSLTQYSAAITACWRFWRYRLDLNSAEKAHLPTIMADIANQIAAIPTDHFLKQLWPA